MNRLEGGELFPDVYEWRSDAVIAGRELAKERKFEHYPVLTAAWSDDFRARGDVRRGGPGTRPFRGSQRGAGSVSVWST
jgi:hypothetical protein